MSAAWCAMRDAVMLCGKIGQMPRRHCDVRTGCHQVFMTRFCCWSKNCNNSSSSPATICNDNLLFSWRKRNHFSVHSLQRAPQGLIWSYFRISPPFFVWSLLFEVLLIAKGQKLTAYFTTASFWVLYIVSSSFFGRTLVKRSIENDIEILIPSRYNA